LRAAPPRAPHGGGSLVAAGSGGPGAHRLTAALDAHRLLRQRLPEPMKPAAGPAAGAPEWAALQRAAAGTDGLDAVRWVPSLREELARARASVSLCGYNTALDLLRARVPADVVPAATSGTSAQSQSACRRGRDGG